MEQAVTVLDDGILGEGSNEFHDLQSTVNFAGCGSGVLKCPGEFFINIVDLKVDPGAAIG